MSVQWEGRKYCRELKERVQEFQEVENVLSLRISLLPVLATPSILKVTPSEVALLLG